MKGLKFLNDSSNDVQLVSSDDDLLATIHFSDLFDLWSDSSRGAVLRDLDCVDSDWIVGDVGDVTVIGFDAVGRGFESAYSNAGGEEVPRVREGLKTS